MVRERISGRDEMGSGGSGEADCSVGSIVWVRRRNGSWWPGKIMGPDELSATHIVSPRTGTPVKLLGREDASVDWYNLEKSKRVKAFRCGEFHECIERAESSLGMPAKKREKYARREDAILHALELEKELLEKEHGQLIASDFKSSKYSDFVKKKLVASSESLRYDNGKHGNADQFSMGSDSYHKDEKVSPLYVPKDKVGNQLGSGDVKSEAIPSMRGLQDFGLKATHSKRKFSYVSSNGSEGPIADNHTYASSCNGVSMGGTSYANSKNLDDIRKRPNEGLTEDIHVKRHDRRRPIVQVPQISAKLPASHLLQPDSCNRYLPESGVDQMGNIWRAKRSRCIYLPSEFSDCLGNRESVPNQMETYRAEGDSGIPGSLMEEKPCEFINDEQSESSETEDLDTDSDEETNSLSGSSETDSETPGGSEVQEKHESVGNEDLDELAVSSDLSNIHAHDHAPANAGISEWQVKGKRNVRYLTKKLGVEADGTYMEEKGITFNRRSLEHNALNEAEIIDKDFRTQMIRLNNRGFTLTSKAASDRQNRTGHDIVDWEDLAWEDQLSFQGYMDAGEYPDPVFIGRQHLGGKMRTTLIDVDLKVQASYKKEHVPIVSLMSKLDGKAIIGHPIQIEVLREGSSEFLFATKNDFGNEAHYNGERTLPPLWRTARRTAHSRVRRPLTSSTLVRDEVAEDPPQLGKERKTLFKKPNAWGFRRKESIPIDLKLSRKLPKKVSSSSSQKTRTLSSIGIEQKLRHQDGDYPLDGLIKTDSAPPAVACIPVKLVFSRLYEAVGRPPSRASIASHEALINMDTETNPL